MHEPFNLNSNICKRTFDYWFTYICEENEDAYINDINDCLHFKSKILKEAGAVHSLNDVAQLVKDKIKYAIFSLRQKRFLVKDPISIFSAQLFASCFNMDVVVLIRHPAAFAGNLKKAGWTYPFDHFLQQLLLMRNHLHSYKSEIQN